MTAVVCVFAAFGFLGLVIAGEIALDLCR